MKLFKRIVFFMAVLMFTTSSVQLMAKTKTPVEPVAKKNKEQVQRTYSGYFDLQQNTVSNIQFYTTNYGIFGLNVATGRGGGYWPRNSQNQYIFGGGIWFGSQKYRLPEDTVMTKYVEVSYNPNNGRSWMVPGHIAYDDEDLADQDETTKYRTYFSTDFNTSDGTPYGDTDMEAWPIWDSSDDPNDTLKFNRYFGTYEADPELRTVAEHPKGPAFISGEDIIAVFKDTDINFFDGGVTEMLDRGYPMRLQFETTIYSWGFGDYKDFIFLKYDIINFSPDTLWQCWMAPVMDVDIARGANSQNGAANDRTRYYEEDSTLNMAFQWTNDDQGEKGYGFGYLGFDFLESPATIHVIDTTIDRTYDSVNSVWVYDTTYAERIVDSTNFVRKDKRFYANAEQLGLRTFRNWAIADDINEDYRRYDFMSSGLRDGDNGPGDKRFMMATGPFHMRPGDTVRVVVAIVLANASVRDETDGSEEDLADLVERDKFAQAVYDNNFRAPTPPQRCELTYSPINNGVIVHWDEKSEESQDKIEDGLDFLGYRLYRARRDDLDTFSVNNEAANLAYPSGKGPFGWKQIAQWQLPTPFQKSSHVAGGNEPGTGYPYIDSLRILYPVIENGQVDMNSIRVLRLGQGVRVFGDSLAGVLNAGLYTPIIAMFDTVSSSRPWGPYYNSFVEEGATPMIWREDEPNHFIMENVMVGKAELNTALIDYNPLLFYSKTETIDDTTGLPENGIVKDETTNEIIKVYLRNTYRQIEVDGADRWVIDTRTPFENPEECMLDSAHVQAALDSLYQFIEDGSVKLIFPDLYAVDESRGFNVLDSVIKPYMEQQTNGRTFVDIGDDNVDGVISLNDDPAKTEKIINNVDYYYKMLAYDEGDYAQKTPVKINSGNTQTPNVVTSIPKAEEIGEELEFNILSVDSSLIGGLYDFKFFAIDEDRVTQLFGGDTLVLEFNPYWDLSTIRFGEDNEREFGLYRRRMTIKNEKTDDVLFDGVTLLEVSPCQFLYRGAFTENSYSYILSDEVIIDSISNKEITFGRPYNREKRYRSGEFKTGDFRTPRFCYNYSFSREAYGTMGFSFRYSLEQWGGRYRPDTAIKNSGVEAITPVSFIDVDRQRVEDGDILEYTSECYTTMEVAQQSALNTGTSWYPVPVYSSFNNGPAEVEVEFVDNGGVETMDLTWNNGADRNTFQVRYLDMVVKNVISYNRPVSMNSLDSVAVRYPNIMEHKYIPIDTVVDGNETLESYPHPKTLGFDSEDMIDKYNISAVGFVNGRRVNTTIRVPRQIAKPVSGWLSEQQFPIIGQQGRYYLTAVSEDGQDTIDFTHRVVVSSCQFVMDYANKARFKTASNNDWNDVYGNDEPFSVPVDEYQWGGPDFKDGDKVTFKTFGGALGLPLPNAKVRFTVSQKQPLDGKYSDDMMDDVMVVPNPYYVTHQGQKSPYDGRIYFTKLPPVCTIEIYTVLGDLIQTIEHDGRTGEVDRHSVEVWDLLSTNKQRIESQTLVALIKTPDGAQTVKKFSVVVGGFRIISDDN